MTCSQKAQITETEEHRVKPPVMEVFCSKSVREWETVLYKICGTNLWDKSIPKTSHINFCLIHFFYASISVSEFIEKKGNLPHDLLILILGSCKEMHLFLLNTPQCDSNGIQDLKCHKCMCVCVYIYACMYFFFLVFVVLANVTARKVLSAIEQAGTENHWGTLVIESLKETCFEAHLPVLQTLSKKLSKFILSLLTFVSYHIHRCSSLLLFEYVLCKF